MYLLCGRRAGSLVCTTPTCITRYVRLYLGYSEHCITVVKVHHGKKKANDRFVSFRNGTNYMEHTIFSQEHLVVAVIPNDLISPMPIATLACDSRQEWEWECTLPTNDESCLHWEPTQNQVRSIGWILFCTGLLWLCTIWKHVTVTMIGCMSITTYSTSWP